VPRDKTLAKALDKLTLTASFLFAASSVSLLSAQQDEKGWHLKVSDNVSLRYGDSFRLEPKLKLQADFLGVNPRSSPDVDVFEFQRKRIGVEGRIFHDFEYEFEAELLTDQATVRDAFVNFRRFRAAEIRAGRFKMPFGYDRLLSPSRLDFVFRSIIGRELAPGREIGAMVHGELLDEGLRYQAGLFRHDGDDAYRGIAPVGGPTAAFRVRLAPDRLIAFPSVLKNLEAGAAVTNGSIDDDQGRIGLRGRSVFGQSYFPRQLVNGLRRRLGTELGWASGPFSVQAEYARVWDQRRKQGIGGEDLPAVVSRSGYVSGAWMLTGERKAGRVNPKKPFLQGGIGAIEVAARWEAGHFGGDEIGFPATNPRAEKLAGASERAWTFGINWYVNRYVKIQPNLIRETLNHFYRTPVSEPQRMWVGVLRLQFSL